MPGLYACSPGLIVRTQKVPAVLGVEWKHVNALKTHGSPKVTLYAVRCHVSVITLYWMCLRPLFVYVCDHWSCIFFCVSLVVSVMLHLHHTVSGVSPHIYMCPQTSPTQHYCNWSVLHQDVDNAALARLDLQRKVESLQEEITFLKKLHDEVSTPLSLFQDGMVQCIADTHTAHSVNWIIEFICQIVIQVYR